MERDKPELVNCDYTDAVIENVVFVGYELKSPIFVRTKFINVLFLNCVLISPDFSHASMQVKFTECSITNANFQGADMQNMVLERMNPQVPQLPQPELQVANLRKRRRLDNEVSTESESDELAPVKKKRTFLTCDTCNLKQRGARDFELHKMLFDNLPFTCAEVTSDCPYCDRKFTTKTSAISRLHHLLTCSKTPIECKNQVEQNITEYNDAKMSDRAI